MERYTTRKDSTPSKGSISPGQRLAVFGPPHLLEGEDQASYEEILARVRAAMEPVDIIEEILVDDLVASQWDAMRLRRLKSSLLNAAGYKKLSSWLEEELRYDEYGDNFERSLAECLEPEFTAAEAQDLARQYSLSEPVALEKVDEILTKKNLDADTFLNAAQSQRATQLTKQYAAGKVGAVKRVDELLAKNGVTKDNLVAQALAEDLETIERFERLTSLAESRRNASLSELDRHRLALGQAARRTVQDIEHGEFRVIENRSAAGKSVRVQRA